MRIKANHRESWIGILIVAIVRRQPNSVEIPSKCAIFRRKSRCVGMSHAMVPEPRLWDICADNGSEFAGRANGVEMRL
jgi:hypothetical protein